MDNKRNVWSKASNWLTRPDRAQTGHFVTSPFGASLATWLWTGELRFWQHWDTVAEYAGLGVLSYGVVAVCLEGVIQGVTLMWWALSQIGKSQRQRQQALKAAREQGQAEAEARMQTDLEYRRQVLSRGRLALRRRRHLRARTADADAARS